MKITINLLSVADAEDILEFELENRSFFESIIPGRADEYFDLENLKGILKELEEEQVNDKRLFVPNKR